MKDDESDQKNRCYLTSILSNNKPISFNFISPDNVTSFHPFSSILNNCFILSVVSGINGLNKLDKLAIIYIQVYVVLLNASISSLTWIHGVDVS